MLEDPFKPPEAELTKRSIPHERDAALELRTKHLVTEQRLKRGGAWLVLSGATMIFVGILAVIAGIMREHDLAFAGFFLVPAGMAYAGSGFALIYLVPGSHVPGSILAYSLFFVFPVGTAIAAFVSHALIQATSTPVLTREYKAAVLATPDLIAPAWSPVLTNASIALAIASCALAFVYF